MGRGHGLCDKYPRFNLKRLAENVQRFVISQDLDDSLTSLTAFAFLNHGHLSSAKPTSAGPLRPLALP
jgi:hypothetical protein